MAIPIRRRELIVALAGAAAWPRVSYAQQPALPVIYLHSGSPAPYAHLVAAFRQGLKEAGYVEGENVAIEYRWAEGRYDHRGPPCGAHRGARWRSFGIGGQIGDRDNTDRVHQQQ